MQVHNSCANTMTIEYSETENILFTQILYHMWLKDSIWLTYQLSCFHRASMTLQGF